LVAELLHGLGYSVQANHETRGGTPHRDEDARFRHVNVQARRFQRKEPLAVSVDAKVVSTEKQMAKIRLLRLRFHGGWGYAIRPNA
jgi:hypothetical protein